MAIELGNLSQDCRILLFAVLSFFQIVVSNALSWFSARSTSPRLDCCQKPLGQSRLSSERDAAARINEKMRALVQRVLRARVTVDGVCVGQIGPGLVVLLGIHRSDTIREAAWLARKIASLRIFEDAAGKMNLSVLENGRQLLIVSQFTLYGDTRKGNRPSYSEAAPPDTAKALYDSFVEQCRLLPGITVETGVFQAHMEVELLNDGPVTVLCQTEGT